MFTSTTSKHPHIAWIIAGGATAAVAGVQLFTHSDPIGCTLRFLKQLLKQERVITCIDDVKGGIDEYNRLQSADINERKEEYKTLVNSYYDLATLFYEWGWGQYFHFANRYPGESFVESLKRHQYYLASKLGLSKMSSDLKLLDVGCGIGGPMRNICSFTGCDITGLTINKYQVDRGNELVRTRTPEIANKCRSVQGDFMAIPFEDNTFDGAFSIQATCHAPDRLTVYSEVFRVLKPGAIYACDEWCMTDKFDPTNKNHLRIKKEIEEGDGLPDLYSTAASLEAMKTAGFEILHEEDLAEAEFGEERGGKRWNLPLLPSWNPFTQRFQMNWLGFYITTYSLKVLEFCFLAPKGTSETQQMLQRGATGLGAGGNTKIFTPIYLMVGRVPMDKDKKN